MKDWNGSKEGKSHHAVEDCMLTLCPSLLVYEKRYSPPPFLPSLPPSPFFSLPLPPFLLLSPPLCLSNSLQNWIYQQVLSVGEPLHPTLPLLLQEFVTATLLSGISGKTASGYHSVPSNSQGQGDRLMDRQKDSYIDDRSVK